MLKWRIILKTRLFYGTATLMLVAILLLAGCGGGTATTSQSSTPTTSQPPATSTAKPATTTSVPATTATLPATSIKPTTSTPATTVPATTPGKQLPATANPITNVNHSTQAKLDALKGLCLMMCHGPGTVNPVPLPPTWDGTKNGSESHPGVWSVVAGSPQDHTGRTDDQCTQAGCHALPGAATTTPATTKPATTTPAGTTTAAILTGKVTIDVTAGGFGYKKVTVAVGTRVVWNNPDHEDHAVVSDSAGVDSFEIGGGATVESDFNKAGSYTLHLEENKAITITITVV
jgi:plastocyanin